MRFFNTPLATLGKAIPGSFLNAIFLNTSLLSTALWTAQYSFALDLDQTHIAVQASSTAAGASLFALSNQAEPRSSRDTSNGFYANVVDINSTGEWNWVEYIWDKKQLVDQVSVYWYVDTRRGYLLPEALRLEYFDGLNWIEVENFDLGLKISRWNDFTLPETIKAKRLRLWMLSKDSSGIIEWKVAGKPYAVSTWRVEEAELCPADYLPITIADVSEFAADACQAAADYARQTEQDKINIKLAGDYALHYIAASSDADQNESCTLSSQFNLTGLSLCRQLDKAEDGACLPDPAGEGCECYWLVDIEGNILGFHCESPGGDRVGSNTN